MRGRVPHALLGLYLATCLLALVWPGYVWAGNRVEPFVAGLPFSFAWVVGWVIATFLALALFHWTTGGERDD